MRKYTMFIGLNDKDSKMQEITTIDAYKIIMRIVKDCTIQESKGCYTHKDGSVTMGTSLIVTIFDFESKIKIQPIIEELKKILNQEAIALVTEEVNSQLL